MKNLTLLIEPPAISEFGNQRIMGGFGSNKSDFAWPPLDLMTISGCLNKYGFKTEIEDFNNTRRTFENVRQTIIKKKPKMVVFSTSSTSIYHDLKIADLVKQVSQDILTVAIGVHIMGLKKEILEYNKNLDVAVYSEPEWVVLNLAKNNYQTENVLGLCFRQDNQIKQNEPQPNIENIEDFGLPSHDKIPIQIYHDPITKRKPLALVMAQRGCVGQCIFCCQPSFWGKLRQRSIPHVIKELKWIEQLGYKEVFWNDSRLTVDVKWSNQLMDAIIDNKIDLTWSCTDHSTSGIAQDPNLLPKMRKAGCHSIRMGIESANPQILKNIKKGTTPERVRQTTKMIKKAGIDVLLFTIFGLPGETKETIKETIDFAKSLDVDYATFGIAQPYPGTPFYKYLKENNYLKTKDWSKYDPTKAPVYQYPNLSSEEILEAHYKALRSFYLRPSYIIKRILKIRSLYDIKNNFKHFIEFLQRYG